MPSRSDRQSSLLAAFISSGMSRSGAQVLAASASEQTLSSLAAQNDDDRLRAKWKSPSCQFSAPQHMNLCYLCDFLPPIMRPLAHL